MNLEALPFLRPGWLLALLLLPLLPRLWRRLHDRAGDWRRACDPQLLARLLEPASVRRGGLAVLMAAHVIAVLALAGPSLRETRQPLLQREAPLAIVLSLSDSMRATDVKPSRYQRARFEIADLLQLRGDGQFALVAYAGEAFTVAPATDDAATLGALLGALSPDVMPVAGADAAAAIAHAVELLRDAGFERGEVLLLADRADPQAVEAARAAKAAGFTVHAIGVGSASGAPIALPQGGFLRDAGGEVVLAPFDRGALAAVAAAGDGRYVDLRADHSDLAALGVADPDAAMSQRRDEVRTVRRDDGPWLLLLLLPVAALVFRRGWIGCVLVLAVWQPAPVQAQDWAALWQRDDQRAWDALQAGEPQRARELATSPALDAAAAYRAGDFGDAASLYRELEGADADYNRGNALAKAGQYREAIEAYDAALAKSPDMEDARANRQAVEDWLQRQQQQPDEQQGQDGEPSDQQPSGQPQPRQPQAGESGEPQDPGAPQPEQPEQQPGDGRGEGEDAAQPQPAQSEQPSGEEAQREFAEAMERALQQRDGEQGERTDAPSAEERERAQAIEQWLRRVPDDPGGLLRRKFAIEYQRRQRGGDGR